jgi:hypothetical protein
MHIRGRNPRAEDVVWPRKPFASRRGSAVAVQFAPDGIYVAVNRKGSAPVWLPRALVLAEDELQQWLRGGRSKEIRPGTDGRLK